MACRDNVSVDKIADILFNEDSDDELIPELSEMESDSDDSEDDSPGHVTENTVPVPECSPLYCPPAIPFTAKPAHKRKQAATSRAYFYPPPRTPGILSFLFIASPLWDQLLKLISRLGSLVCGRDLELTDERRMHQMFNMIKLQSSGLLFLLLAVAAVHVDGKKYYDQYHDHRYDHYDRRGQWDSPVDKYHGYGPHKYYGPKTHTFIANFGPNPPPPEQGAKMARYIVHNADWASIATISSNREVRTFPFANIVSISDGTPTNSSGVPYMYLTPMDMSSQDLEIDSRCSLAISLAEGDYCKQKSLDPEDPRCARVILTGKLKRIKTYTPEIEFAENAMFTRHPAMRSWPASHNWFFAKIKIEQIVVLDYFGGPKFISRQDYFNPPGMVR
ncbi:uncharacterized protein CREG [Anabrus simplex]|uniref:uncharacterized protein CREG n=1 Tax=Anabrus simplex TaxID=316456 RepID=UPI0035A2B5FF